MEIRQHPHRLRAVAVLAVVGPPSYILCFLWHICMAGHMQHGPYSPLEWINDFLWTACLVAVAVFSTTLHAKRRTLFVVGSTILISSRLLLGSLGGGDVLIELPLLIVMNIYALRYLIRPRKFLWPNEDVAPLQPSAAPKTRTSFCVFGLVVLGLLALWQYFHG